MENRLAIIDLGSNTCRLVIFAFSPQSSFRLIDQVSERVRIGEGMFSDNRLQPEPMARAVELLKMFRELCDVNAIGRVIGTATSAVRDARNQEEFLSRVQEETGLHLRVLSGDQEAYYAYLGVINSFAFENGIIADLGGGSLEMMRVRNRLPSASASLPLGAVRLSEQFLSDDPISPAAVRALTAHIEQHLDQAAWLRLESHDQLIVLGGTIRALAKIQQRREDYALDHLHGYIFGRAPLKDLADELVEKPLDERKKIKGLSDERADVIPAGAMVVWELMKHLGAKTLTVSGQGLREGVFYEEFLRDVVKHNSYPASGAPLAKGAPAADALPAAVGVPLIPDIRAFTLANLSYLYEIDWLHAEQVCHLSLALFDQLHALHHLHAPERALLGAAALLHDVGVVIDYYRHHRHSAYLIENAVLAGFTHREIALMALLVLWHRHGEPKVQAYASMLDGGDEQRVKKLSAILRLAEDLDRSRTQAVRTVRCRVSSGVIQVEALTGGAAEAELWAANRDTEFFDSVYGHALHVTARSSEPGPPRRITTTPLSGVGAQHLVPSIPRAPDSIDSLRGGADKDNILERAERISQRLSGVDGPVTYPRRGP